MIGARYSGNEPFNGTIDEVAMYDYSFNSSQVLDLYNNQTTRFKQSGTQIFNNTDISADSPNRVNISLLGYGNLKGSKLGFSIDDEDVVNFTDGNVTEYDLSGVGDLSNCNVTITFYAGDDLFYSPILYNSSNLTTYSVSEVSSFVTFVTPTLDDSAVTGNEMYFSNTSIESSNLKEVIFNWDGTNYTVYNESLIMLMNFSTN